MAATVIWLHFLIILARTSCQKIGPVYLPATNYTVCEKVECYSLESLKQLENCTVVYGYLRIALMERTHEEDFSNITFPNLREVTGYMVVYRVRGLETLGKMFPNLARIRGAELIDNFAFIVYDIASLKEIGLYSLLKIDRGGVIVWGVPESCYVDTVDWNKIAPRSRHILSTSERLKQCSGPCTCTRNISTNHCWNIRKCQRFLEGPEADVCHEQCLGCRRNHSTQCTLCRNFTYQGECVTKCPENTLILAVNQYCITEEECKKIKGWAFNDTCVFDCPTNFAVQNDTKEGSGLNISCKPCNDCQKNCQSRRIQSLSQIQQTGGCVNINGSLVIHLSAVPEAMDELRTYLSKIEEVSDYIVIFGSLTITSLDFLPSLKRIQGRNLKNGNYSLMVHDMSGLQNLFTNNVTKHLIIERGTMKFMNNPMLCSSKIEKLKRLFPIKPSDLDIPHATNGYVGSCTEMYVRLQVKVINETTVIIMFTPLKDPGIQYTILYVHLPSGTKEKVIPETCSEFEWFAVNVPHSMTNHTNISAYLTSLKPGSEYATCIEIHNVSEKKLARSSILNFTTSVGKPKPPFLLELVASSSKTVVIRWVNHKNYIKHIKRYELDVTLIDNRPQDVNTRNYCAPTVEYIEDMDEHYSRHAVVMKPPADYAKGCESMCGILSAVTPGAMNEEDLDICSSLDSDCDDYEDEPPVNSTFSGYIRSIHLVLNGPKNDFRVGNLAPYRDYRFRLRACTDFQCSRSSRGVVRTLPIKNADIPVITFVEAYDTGYIFVTWQCSKITNGLILTYFVQVIPKITFGETGKLLPQVWCVSSDKNSLILKTRSAERYSVRVCAKTLVSESACSEWEKLIAKPSPKSYWWVGILIGMILYAISISLGLVCKLRNNKNDEIPLVSTTVTYNDESDPPSILLTDSNTLYSIPLRDTLLD